MEVGNVLQAKAYALSEEENVPIIKNWLCKGELHFIWTLTNAKEDTCKSSTSLFDVLREKFRLQHNELILSLHYSKLQRKENESSQQ